MPRWRAFVPEDSVKKTTWTWARVGPLQIAEDSRAARSKFPAQRVERQNERIPAHKVLGDKKTPAENEGGQQEKDGGSHAWQ